LNGDLTARLEAADGLGTVFLYCDPRDRERVGAFTLAAREAGRRVFGREECRKLNPEALAGSPGKKAILVLPSMMGFLERYLGALPVGQRRLLIQERREGERCPMGFPFHDFWEERGVEIVSVSRT